MSILITHPSDDQIKWRNNNNNIETAVAETTTTTNTTTKSTHSSRVLLEVVLKLKRAWIKENRPAYLQCVAIMRAQEYTSTVKARCPIYTGGRKLHTHNITITNNNDNIKISQNSIPVRCVYVRQWCHFPPMSRTFASASVIKASTAMTINTTLTLLLLLLMPLPLRVGKIIFTS